MIMVIVLASVALWLLYLYSMPIIRRYETMGPAQRVALLLLAGPIVAAGYMLDVLYNLIIATVLFLDWPREWTLTARLVRYLKTDTGWRADIAGWICRYLLEPVDPGHCYANKKG